MGSRGRALRSLRLAALLPVCWATVATAEPPPVHASGIQLDVARTGAAQGCPDAATLREGVISRLGYDPFTRPVARVVLASFEASSHGYSATVIMKDPEGRPLGLQQLSYQLTNCDALAAAIELAIAVALDPLAAKPEAGMNSVGTAAAIATVTTTSTATATANTTATATVTPAASATAEVRGEPSEPDWLLYAGVDAVFLATPATTVPALSVGVELRITHASLGLELQGNFAGHEAVGAGSIGVSQLLVVLAPCYHWGFFGACGVLAAGAQQAYATGLDPSLKPTTPYFALGARVAADLPLAKWLWVRPQADVWFPTNRTSLQVAGVTQWRTPAVSPSVGVALVVPIQ